MISMTCEAYGGLAGKNRSPPHQWLKNDGALLLIPSNKGVVLRLLDSGNNLDRSTVRDYVSCN